MTQKHNELRVLIVGSAHTQIEFQRQLAPLNLTLLFVCSASDLSQLVHEQEFFHVALLPAALLEVDWRVFWEEICFLRFRPSLVVYAPTASFKLWTAVLESGGYDVIVEPFVEEELQGAVLRAARSLEDRA
ncbi:hypothetical protein [Granulicella sp. S190]|uniref:hypothetical protein n=1 Tax=Granulicella sp. S190 TaxID=1747226 RepID=UPI00131DF3F0|nr:hypothetical protein [Granulicella sp. S190]